MSPRTPLRPGERLVAGKPYIFDLNALNAYEADQALANMPADLSGLTDEAITGLYYAWLNVHGRTPRDAAVNAAGAAICAERETRPALVGAFKPRVPAQSSKQQRAA